VPTHETAFSPVAKKAAKGNIRFVELHFFAGTDKELSSPRGSGAAP